MPLRTLLALVFALVALALSLCGALATQQLTSERLKQRIGGEMAGLAGQVRNLLDRSLYGRWRDVRVLAAVARTTAPSPEARRAWVEALRQTFPAYAWIGFANLDGVVTAATDQILEGVSVASRPWFQAALKAPYAGDLHEAVLLADKLPARPDGAPWRFVDISAPVLDGAGRIEGVIGAHLSWTWVDELTRSVIDPVAARSPGTDVLVIDEGGKVILGSPDLQGRPLPAVSGVWRNAGPGDTHALETWPDGATYLVGASRTVGMNDYPGLGWTVLVRQNADIAFAPARRLARDLLLGGIGFAGAAALLGWLIARQISRPLLALADAADALRHSPSTASLPSPEGTDEVRRLSSAMSGLLGAVADRDRNLAEANRGLERRVAERTRDLAKSESFVRSIVDSSPDCVKVLDRKGRITFINGNGACLSEVSDPAAIVGQTLDALWPEAARMEVRQQIVRAASGETVHFVTERPSAEGSPTWWDVSLTPIADRYGAPESILAVSRDITANKIREDELKVARDAAEQASRAKTEFLASMSHEIRTPLNGVLGYTDILLEEGGLGDKERRHVERIQSAGSALLTVVDDILDFSKIEAGQIDLQARPFRLEALIDNAMSIVGGSAKAKGLDMAVMLDERVPGILLGDQDRLRQVLLNLLNNAVKFTPIGRVALTVEATEGGERPTLRFAVADTGIGIAPEELSRLFRRFSQVDGSVSRRFGGSGLGLAISKRLVELMGGQIGVESRPGRGSTFWFTARLPKAEEAEADAEAPSLRTDMRPSRVLVVDDLPMNQAIVRAMLEAAGHQADVVGNGADAITAVGARSYDMVFMDIQMPTMDGMAATAAIRALPPPAGDVPIVALTANVLPAEVAAFRRAGMNGHVGKPFKRAELLAAVALHAGDDAGEAPPVAGAANEPGRAFDEHVFDDLVSLAGEAQVRTWLALLRDALDEVLLGEGAADLETDTLRQAAHTLTSQAGMLGFADLSDQFRTLEDAIVREAALEPSLARTRAAAEAARLAIAGLLARSDPRQVAAA